MTLTTTTITELRHITHDSSGAIKILAKDRMGRYTPFTCQKIVRCLPEKRISCIGKWQDKTVFAKLFIAKQRAKIHCSRERKGVELLHSKQINAPKILHLATALNNEVHIIIFDFIAEAVSAQTAWDNASTKAQQLLFKKLVTLIAEHHNKGIIQADLHLGNFLLRDDVIFSLDGSDISHSKIKLQRALDNLALFFAQFYPANDTHIERAFLHYGALRNWVTKQSLIDAMLQLTLIKREKRKQKFLAKIYRENSLFAVKTSWKKHIICNRNYLSKEMLELLNNPNKFIDCGELLKSGNTATLAAVALNDKQLVVKRYNIKNILHGVSRALRQSRASISWKNAHMLNFYGIATAKPVALIINRWGFIQKKAYYIAEFKQAETGLDFFQASQHTDQDKSDVANKVLDMLKTMHSLGITHGDLKASNVIITELCPSLIDLDSMRQHSNKLLLNRARKKDLHRFLKNWENTPLATFFKQRE